MAGAIRNPRDKKKSETMNALVRLLLKFGLLNRDLDYHLIRASMVLIFLALATRNGSPMRHRS